MGKLEAILARTHLEIVESIKSNTHQHRKLKSEDLMKEVKGHEDFLGLGFSGNHGASRMSNHSKRDVRKSREGS